MKPALRLPLLIAGLGVAMALLAMAGVAAIWATLEATERSVLAAVLETRGMVLVMVWLAGFGLAAWGASRLFARFVVAPARLHERAQAMLAGAAVHELAAEGSAANRDLTATLNALLRQRAQLQQDVAQQVALASRGIEAERSRLSALMAELTQSVVVCNLEGAILLYNSRARAQFRAWSSTPGDGRWRRADRPRPLDLRRLRPAADRPRARERPPAHAGWRGQPVGAVRHRHAGRPAAARADGAGARPGERGRSRRRAERLRPDARRHDPRLRTGGPARPPAARPDRRQPRFARQPAGGGRDARAARPRSADARALPGGRARRGRSDDGAPAVPGRRSADRAEDALADGRHARRRPGRGRCAAHRSPRFGAGERRRGRSDPLAEGRQLLAAAGARLPRRPAGRRAWRAFGETALAGRRNTGPARPGVDRPGDEYRDRDELADGGDAQRRGRDAADAARCRRAPRRRILVRARAGPARGVLPLSAALFGRRGSGRGRAVRGRGRAPRVLRLRPVSDLGAGARIRRSRRSPS